jgi:ABC-type multidrug transport system fused ATPase/permease subunit
VYKRQVVKVVKKPIAPDNYNGLIHFKDVSFSYDTEEIILKDLTFDAKPDQMTAFVGGSGAGKSTLFKLIPRFYDVTSGSIKLDGVNIDQMDTKILREKIAIVPQETYLFAMSIFENIACGRPDATDEEIYKAAKMANAHDFIEALPEGYDTIAGERGTRLSGGQRQRIAIARAFLKNPLILLLDEATSALDNNSEKQVQQTIQHLMNGRTTLVIAHRLSTVRHADVIHVVDNGKIAASGNHDLLMETSEIYKKLYLDGLQ